MDIIYKTPNILFMEERKMKKISSYWEIRYVTKNGMTKRNLVQASAMPDNVYFLGVRLERAKFTPYKTVAFVAEAEAKLAAIKSASTRALKAKTSVEIDKYLSSMTKNLGLLTDALYSANEMMEQESNNENAELLNNAVEAAFYAYHTALSVCVDTMERFEVAETDTDVEDADDEPNKATDAGNDVEDVDDESNKATDAGNDVEDADDEPNEATDAGTDVEDVDDEPNKATDAGTDVEDADNESDYTSMLAKEYSLTAINWNEFGIYSSENGEFFVFVPDGEDHGEDCFFSLAPVTRETGEAFTGEKPMAGLYSPDDFAQLLNSIGAKIPTRRQYKNFVTLLNSVTGSNTAMGLMRAVLGSISTVNQLIQTDDSGHYATYMGEYPYITKDTALNNIACHKVFK